MQAFAGLGGAEIILILALVLILFGAKKLPELTKGLGQGLFEFRKAIDNESTEAGRSLGGIYGKPAAQAITSDNQVAELYDHAALRDKTALPKKRNRLSIALSKIWQRLLRILHLNASTF
jgi:sec-independent protein translocase protein TatA